MWEAIRSIIGFCKDCNDEIPGESRNEIVETGLRSFDNILKSSSENFRIYKMQLIENIASALSRVLCEAMAPFYKERRVVSKCLEVCQTNATEWFKTEEGVCEVIGLVGLCIYHNVLSDEDLLEWAPLIGRAISENLTNDEIQNFGEEMIRNIVNKVDHRKLEITSLPSSLQAIIQSTDASEELKAKCRSILSTIYQ